jgi:hypothetical protein
MKLLALLLLVSLLGCESSTKYGRCVGINDVKDPTLVYKYSARNLIIGVVFFQMIAPPILVGLNELQCPVGKVP